ncbi:MAG: hypothetical protein CMD01_01170 [Flavobacteriales bacterium]|nr:hypothetical protein [Flavobacteriales bacterium]MBG14912.1 hypothetical protein [Crocinitomicaceae bacterium]|tara:strand:- start:3679 stop:4260 length:582 start_codon:yes stop_codon:yes gene_type:complete
MSMGHPTNKVTEVCKLKFEDFKKKHSIDTSTFFVSHFGELSQEMVNDISIETEQKMIQSGDKKVVVKKAFNILVEGLQNIRLHGAKDKNGIQTSFLKIAKDELAYKILMGNLVSNNSIKTISDKINLINSSDLKQIKEMYVATLTNGIISKKGGAGLGFITMAMKSKNNLDFNFEPINSDISCFSVELILNRQ